MKKIALAGNPNVGKSTFFNALTGLKQHTGNWAGKTVSNACGKCTYENEEYQIYDLPGTYSLSSHSKEEEVARDFICFTKKDATIVVCDATCLERNLNLVLQILEISNKVVVCVNLIDEAKKKKIKINFKKLEQILKVPVIPTSARKQTGIYEVIEKIKIAENQQGYFKIKYPNIIEEAIDIVEPLIINKIGEEYNTRWISLKLIDDDKSLINSIKENINIEDKIIEEKIKEARKLIEKSGIKIDEIKDITISKIVEECEKISNEVVTFENLDYKKRDKKIDRILTNKLTGIPIMILLLMLIFWITIVGANYPSDLLFKLFNTIGIWLSNALNFINTPPWLYSILIEGIYRVLSWVVAVMLPPMAIFFPLFTLLEDLGYLPRVAFNLDKIFKKCNACGKQALTMCMGFGCNAAAVTGARIIDSKRERLIAILTNCFVPCNGRFPTIISIITMFFVGFSNTFKTSFLSIVILTLIILSGILMTFLVSKLLSKTILKGIPSSFTLELPPYRRPQVISIIVRSIFDRTLFVLGRAVLVAIPAGLIIWISANVNINGISILSYCSNFLDPFGKLLGLDGVILMGFILGFPANEIVLPIIIMAYLQTGNISQFPNLEILKELLISNGWTIKTAICMIVFSLFHFPCSTTSLTIKKETGSFKWTLISIVLPTLIGIVLCFIINLLL